MNDTVTLATNIIEQFNIPPRPQALIDVEREMHKDTPDIDVIAEAIRGDVAISGAMLQVINSPFFRISVKVSSIPEAIRFLGLERVGSVVRHVALRNSLGDGGLDHFWDTATEVAELAAELSLHLTGLTSDEAYAAGLFHDCGIPLLVQKYPDVREIFRRTDDPAFLHSAELEMCEVDHYEIGSQVGQKWFLSDNITNFIRILPSAEQVLAGELEQADAVKQLLALILMAKNLNSRIRQFWRAGTEVSEIPVWILDFFDLSIAEYDEMADQRAADLEREG